MKYLNTRESTLAKDIIKRMGSNCNHATCQGECRRPKQKKLRIPVRKVSKKRANENRIYTKLRQQFLEEHPVCEAGLNGCTVVATDVHHSEGRIGDKLLDVSTYKAVCRNCHKQIEE